MGIKVVVIASGGGHWIQLKRLQTAYIDQDVTWIAADPALSSEVPEGRFLAVQDASRESPFLLIKSALQLMRIMRRVRPDVVITTGAAPGLFGLVFGKLSGARTLWIDSVANAERLSMSARLARPFADVVLTQWKHLAGKKYPRYEGSVL